MDRSAAPTSLGYGVNCFTHVSLPYHFLDPFEAMFEPHSLYWIDLYESVSSKKWEWFIRDDLARPICNGVRRFMGRGEHPSLVAVSPQLTQTGPKKIAVFGALFAIRGTLVIASLSSIPVFLFAYFLPGVDRDLWFATYVMINIFVQIAWLTVSLFVPCVLLQKSGIGGLAG